MPDINVPCKEVPFFGSSKPEPVSDGEAIVTSNSELKVDPKLLHEFGMY